MHLGLYPRPLHYEATKRKNRQPPKLSTFAHLKTSISDVWWIFHLISKARYKPLLKDLLRKKQSKAFNSIQAIWKRGKLKRMPLNFFSIIVWGIWKFKASPRRTWKTFFDSSRFLNGMLWNRGSLWILIWNVCWAHFPQTALLILQFSQRWHG